jgi:restriction endonuclease S subunit
LTAGKTFILGYTNEKSGIFLQEKLPVIIFDDFTTASKFVDFPFKVKSSAMKILHAKKEKVDIKFAFHSMRRIKFSVNEHKRYWISQYSKIKIPLPPLSVQKEIVEQIEVKQNAIDHAKAIIQNLERERRYFGQALRKLEGVEWVDLGEVCDVRDGTHDSPKFVSVGYPLVTSKNIKNNTINFDDVDHVSAEDYKKIIKRSGVDNGDIIMPMIGTIGSPIVVKKDRDFVIKNVALIKFVCNTKLINYYVQAILASNLFENYIKEVSRGGTQKFISLGNIRDFQIPLPPIEIQKKLVAEAEKEQQIINANKQLIEIMEQKISDVLSEI